MSGWVGDFLSVRKRRQVGVPGLGSFFSTQGEESRGAPGISKTHTVFRVYEMLLVHGIECSRDMGMGTIHHMPIINIGMVDFRLIR